MININGDDDIAEIGCDCCGAILRISHQNMHRLGRAAELRFPPHMQIGAELVFDIGSVPADVDLTEQVSASDIRRVVEAAFRMELVDG